VRIVGAKFSFAIHTYIHTSWSNLYVSTGICQFFVLELATSSNIWSLRLPSTYIDNYNSCKYDDPPF